jgi:hypothetical protein
MPTELELFVINQLVGELVIGIGLGHHGRQCLVSAFSVLLCDGY